MANRTIKQLKIIQHNVLTWTVKRHKELGNYFNRENPDIILLNETAVRDQNRIKIFNYNIHQVNTSNEMHAGTAVAVRKDITYQLIDGFNENIVGVKVETTKGPIITFTY